MRHVLALTERFGRAWQFQRRVPRDGGAETLERSANVTLSIIGTVLEKAGIPKLRVLTTSGERQSGVVLVIEPSGKSLHHLLHYRGFLALFKRVEPLGAV